jgi:F-type H+-transporting ATPase subunit b
MLGRIASLSLFAFLTPAFAWAAETAEAAAPQAAESSSSMPQLDPTFYVSELFWLFATGIALYIVMSKVALPRVAKMVDLRDTQVQHDLEQAYKLKQQAENLKIDYTRALRDADEQAQTRVDKVVKQMKDQHSAAIEAALARVNTSVTEAEKNLTSQKDTVLKDITVIADKLAANINTQLKRKQA